MKGVVFTELLEMVEEKFSLATAQGIVDDSAPASGGAYTAVGTYPVGEMVDLVAALSRRTGLPVPALLQAFGEYLAGRFARKFSHFFAEHTSTLDFVAHVEDYIHVEVRKLYPDAELPHFDIQERAPGRLTLLYRSPRCMADLAEGLIRGCAAQYREPLDIAREDLSGGRGEQVRFVLTSGVASTPPG
jgi:hypothetical protein